MQWLKCNLVYKKHWLETLVKLCSAGSSTDSYGRMSTTPGQKEHALSDPSETISVMSTFSVAAAFISLMSFEFGDIHLSLRFRVRLVWNFGNCSYTHTHLAHTCTHLPPSVLTPPPVDDFWGPHNGRQVIQVFHGGSPDHLSTEEISSQCISFFCNGSRSGGSARLGSRR